MITFVSAFLKLENNILERFKDLDNCFFLFENLFKVKDIKIVLFLSHDFKEKGDELLKKYNHNLNIVYLELDDLWTYKEVKKIDNISLPMERNHSKDNERYLALQNSKLELIQKAISQNHFQTNYFAWIDFRIFHIVKEDKNDLFVSKLSKLNESKFKNNFLTIPGCYDKWLSTDFSYMKEIYQYLDDRISWRFCGGFFLGDKESLLHFFEKFKYFWVLYLSKNKITWEVNIWHYMEFLDLLNPLWYYSSHDENMVNIPETCFQS
jgi:hypothetical protein